MNASLWPMIGEVILGIALGFGAYSWLAPLFGLKASRTSLSICTALITVATLLLWTQLVGGNYLIRYVYSYSNSSMPFIYKLTALWGGQEGSLLFWVWLNSIFAALAVYFHKKTDSDLMPGVIGVFGFILTFFLSLIFFHENPFKTFPIAPADGRGLNPLLQNPSMAIHPPSLYLGYVGMSVPFAFAISALMSNQLGTRWIQATRRWLLLSWFFLSIGNLLGAQWAYVELGWGGFWGWDPVENAAIMPWFTASAFLHSVMIQERRGLLKFWNMNLVVISFALTILGTYLTRSGVVQSVHSFARSEIGYYFLGFLIFIILFSAFWIFKRRKELESPTIFESFLSKESAFVVNNIVLIGAAFIVLWCTLFPTASELIVGTRIVVGPPFFNQMLAPIGIVLLILTGIGPLIGWRKASKENLKFHFLWPTICGTVVLGGAALLGITNWYVLGTTFGAAFVLATIVAEFNRGTRARMHQYKESWSNALIRATFAQNRRYGGYIVHLGIVFIFIGIAGSAYKRVYEFRMQETSSASVGEYTFQLKGFQSRQSKNQEEFYAVVDVFVGAEKAATLRPARYFYFKPEQPSTEVDIYSRWREDVYLTLGQVFPDSREAIIHVTLNPLVSFLWFGGLILILGALIAMLPSFKWQNRVLEMTEDKERALMEIKELDIDYQAKKISPSEYETLRQQLIREAALTYKNTSHKDGDHQS